MAFLGPEDLKSFLNETIISPYNEKRIEQAAYELSLGNEVYRTDAKNGKKEIFDKKNQTVEINPGQFTLLLTKERVAIPADKLAFISIKAKQKLKGLINVSGFHVDPGFKGQLLFSVYNAGPSPITLETNKPYFLIWFSELKSVTSNSDIYNSKSNTHQNQAGIPTDYIDALKGGELASPNVLLNRVKKNENKLGNILWAAAILIGFAIAIGGKIYSDHDYFKKGVTYSLDKKELEGKIESKIDEYLSEIVSLKMIDSLIDVRVKQKHEKNK